MGTPAIIVENVTKVYRLWASPSARLRYSLLSQGMRAARPLLRPGARVARALGTRRDALARDFFALQDVSFEVLPGESVGIIGRNGSGKSTLLQIIAGTLQSTAGHVEVRGRLAALLELGSGFNPEFTGRENVFLNAALLGLTRAETEGRFDQIAGFADIGDFLDQPVKTYSSGMMVRLAFAVQAAVEPDILIVDEALAVGDIYFQNKCFKLLKQRQESGMTLLFVSHDTSSVRSLCQRGLFLREGRRMFWGSSEEAVNAYVRAGDQPAERAGASDAAESDVPKEVSPAGIWQVPRVLGPRQDEIGGGEMEIVGAECFDARGRPARVFLAGAPMRFGFRFRAKEPLDDVLAGFSVRDKFNNVVCAMSTLNQGMNPITMPAGAEREIFLEMPGRLGGGEYLLDFGLGGGESHSGQAARHYHRVGGILSFAVAQPTGDIRFAGLCDLGGSFAFDPPAPAEA